MRRHWPTVVGIVIVVGLIGAMIFSWWNGGPSTQQESVVNAGVGRAEEPAGVSLVVHLTDAKRDAAGVRVAALELRSFQRTHQVPARLQYDDTRHIEIETPADGVLLEYHVKPGDRVARGQLLAVLSSPEVGLARADVSRRRSDLQLAVRQFEWHRATDQNLQQLVREIRNQRALAELESQFRDRPLGEFRETLLTAYSRWLLAESAMSSIQSASDMGAVAARTLRERTGERQTTEAVLRTACEQTSFRSRQQCAAAEAAAQDAQRRLDIARQHLRTLLGYEDETSDPQGTSPSAAANENRVNLSFVECRAPFAGTIESRRFAAAERIRQGDILLVLADTASLWVVADIREKDWETLRLSADEEMALEIPALPDQRYSARLYYLGREVAPGTNAIPLVAKIDNSDVRLRPGLYARLSIPLGNRRECLLVPSAAVVQHEGQPFVFVVDAPNRYRRVDVQVGEQTDEWIEVTGGLAAGAPVVVEGAFFLKSELLLEREE